MSSSTIFQVLRFEDEGKRVVVIKRDYAAINNGTGGRTEVFIEGAASLVELGVGEPIAYAVPIAIPNQDNAKISEIVAAAFRGYDDRAQKAVNDLFLEYKAFKEKVESERKLVAVESAATKILGAP